MIFPAKVAFCLAFLLYGAKPQNATLSRSPPVPAVSRLARDGVRQSALGNWGEQGDGTYLNPVLPGDFSDLDVIRVGDDFYAISSTMQYAPGMVVLHSRDLVSWQIVSHVVADLTDLDPQLGWQRMGQAGRGIWAGAIRQHAGRFWVYFGTPDDGIFVSTARQATGPWSPPTRVLSDAGWDDPCPFWDVDGRPYLVATRFAADADGQSYRIHLFEMSRAGTAVIPTSDRVIHHSPGSEANKLYRIHGLYYHYFSEVKPEGRVAMMERAASLRGPWEVRQLDHVNARIDQEPNQGGFIELRDGSWWFLTHLGAGNWEGRAGVLLPVTWIDNWPIPGEVGKDKIGNMVWRGSMPYRFLHNPSRLFVSDAFTGKALKPQWEWRNQPRSSMWQLTGGGLRMDAFAGLASRNFAGVRNVLTQRAARSRSCEVTVQLDLEDLTDGEEAGLAHFAGTNARIAVARRGSEWRIERIDDDRIVATRPWSTRRVWLRSRWDADGIATFYYSGNGTHYEELGSKWQLSWADYRGDRIGLYTFNTAGASGSVDFHDFRYAVDR